MVVEYICTCGFKTIFRNKYLSHAKTCGVPKQREKDARGYRPDLAALGSEAG